MATFIVEEIPKKTAGNRPEAGVRFEWTAQNFSMPRGPWEYGVAVRTVRTDYPGSTEPSEQVLGSNFEPFTMSGVWDDKYNGGELSGFAEDTRVAFEQMVRRGNLCRIQLAGALGTTQMVVYGLITHFKAMVRDAHRCGYEFTVSPHYRDPAGDVRTNTALAPKPTDSPDSYAAKIKQLVDDLHQRVAAAPSVYMVGNTYANVVAAVDTISEHADTLTAVVSGRVLSLTTEPAAIGSNSLSRMVSALQAVRDASADLIPLADVSSDAAALSLVVGRIIWEQEDWTRAVRADARALILLADAAARDMASLVSPDVQALYRPTAGESLYSISTRFYGTADRWRDIYTRNGLIAFTMTGLETLAIPQRAPGA